MASVTDGVRMDSKEVVEILSAQIWRSDDHKVIRDGYELAVRLHGLGCYDTLSSAKSVLLVAEIGEWRNTGVSAYERIA